MKNGITQTDQTTRRILLIVCVAALAVAFTVSPPRPVYADEDLVPPPVPPDVDVPPGNKVFLKADAVGTQNYICLPSGWTFFGPQATLFNDHDKQLITHFLSKDPSGIPLPTWQHSRDTSTVWAMPVGSSPGVPGAIPLLLLEAVETEPGPTDGERLTRTTFIQRLNTSGGIAPSTECPESIDVGTRAFEPYGATYFFYKAVKSE